MDFVVTSPHGDIAENCNRRRSNAKFCEIECGQDWVSRGGPARNWAGLLPLDSMPHRYGSCIEPVSANPKSPATCKSAQFRTPDSRLTDLAAKAGTWFCQRICTKWFRRYSRPDALDGIENTRMIQFTYHDKDRLVEPQDHGVPNGSVQLLRYQFAGSSSRPLPSWLLTKVVEISDTYGWVRLSRAGAPPAPANISDGTCSSSGSNQTTDGLVPI
jgi:hypothetical protein